MKPVISVPILAAALTVSAHAQSAPALPDVLRSTGTYVEHYGQTMSAVVMAEDYIQRVTAGTRQANRHLKSDVLLVTDAVNGWVTFRDVIEVDGSAVHDRDERLAKLFTAPDVDVRDQARRIAEEGARYNLSTLDGLTIDRTINTPFMALRFLQSANQPRSAFKIARIETVAGTRAVVLDFEEHGTPRLVLSHNNAAMHGSAWIEPESGAVLRTRLQFTAQGARGRSISGTIQVGYGIDAKINAWVPESMDEQYNAGTSNYLTGHAVYSNLRQFNVTEDQVTKPVH